MSKVRNIGISAHVDSGKTTLTERVLFYSGKQHQINEVKGNTDKGATMDSMELEAERGITIASAATQVEWNNHTINLIDTPGHVDFTVEVERSLRVLDGAVLVLCSVGGVQAQSLTVDRQMKRYGVSRVAFINKCDRTGADPFKVVEDIKTKLGDDAFLVQYPIGLESDHVGHVCLITGMARYFGGKNGEKVRIEECPSELKDKVAAARADLLESLCMYSDDLAEIVLMDEEPTVEQIEAVLTKVVKERLATPVYLGSAFKNVGVQSLLDAVTQYLPSPQERDHTDANGKALSHDPSDPVVSMAFKLEESQFGLLSYTRVYQGTVKKGMTLINQRNGKQERVSRLFLMHADQRTEVDEALPGAIVGILGFDAASGDTYCSEKEYASLEGIHAATPVITLSVEAKNAADNAKMTKALQRFRKEDPSFQVRTDEESGQTLISGMGELHLEIYIERIKREYNTEVLVGPPQVAYREAPTQDVEIDHKRKKQSGGSGQYGHIKGTLGINPDGDDFVFEDAVTQGRIPAEFIPSIEKGIARSLEKGPLAKFPVVGVSFKLIDGTYHEVDSSKMSFQATAAEMFRKKFELTKPCLLEPVMKVELECSPDHQGTLMGDISVRRGMVSETATEGMTTRIEAEVPLAEMFGYSSAIRSMTGGTGSFSMEFAKYAPTPKHIQAEVIKARQEADKK